MNESNFPPETPSILTFFGDYRFLSNFWMSEFVWNGVLWPSTECAYQAAKVPDDDPKLMREYYHLFAQMRPSDAKRAGKGWFKVKIGQDERGDPIFKQYTFELRSDWEEVKVQIMYEIVKAKFSQNPELKAKLLATGDAHLEEGNTWGDRIWGVCPPGSGNGRNELGKVLMRVRRELLLEWE